MGIRNERVFKLLKEKHMKKKDIANALGISPSAVTQWEKNGTEPTIEQCAKLSVLFNTPINEIVTDMSLNDITIGIVNEIKSRKYKPYNDTKYIGFENTTMLPIYGRIPAGISKEAIQEVEGYVAVPTFMVEGHFALKVIGDSMYPKYLDGDVVIIKEQPDCENGQDCAVRINDNDVTLKKVIKMEDGLMLQPLNPEYPPQFFSYNDETCPVYILGVVVEIRRKV